MEGSAEEGDALLPSLGGKSTKWKKKLEAMEKLKEHGGDKLNRGFNTLKLKYVQDSN